MIKLLSNIYKRAVLEAENKLQEQQAIKQVISESGLVTERQDADGYQRISDPTDVEKGHDEGDQREMLRNARKMFRHDFHARAIIQTMQNFMVGRGFDIRPKSEDPRIKFIWSEFWNSERSKMRIKKFEIITRFFRDGEVFIEFFSQNEGGNETGLTTCRFLDPLLIKNPFEGQAKTFTGEVEITRNGIEVDPDDVETVVAYHVKNRDKKATFRRIPAENVLHLKAFADSDQRRGETLLQTVMPLIAHYNNWLENRIILNRMRTAIVMIRKITGTAAEISPLKGKLGPVRRSDGATVIRPGKIINANAGVDYKMESPNINAADVADDGRAIKLGIAAGTNLPEYVLGDASNANFASTLIAESPFVKAIEYWQIILEEFLKKIFKKVIENAVKAGRLQQPSDDEFVRKIFGRGKLEEQLSEEEMEKMMSGTLETPSEIFFGADIQWPEIVHRDLKQHAEALMIARQAGWISDATASGSLGYDWDEEVRKQDKAVAAAKEKGNSLLGVSPEDGEIDDDDDMDNEIDDVLSQIGQLSDEERQMILKTNNPMDIAKLIMTRQNGNGKQPVGGNGNGRNNQ